MKILNGTYEQIAKRVREESKKIVVYGAGMIGSILVPYLLRNLSLQDYMLFFVDSDLRKHDEMIVDGSYQYPIRAPYVLDNLPENTLLLITNSNYIPIVDFLDSNEHLKNVEAYIIPIIQVLNTHRAHSSLDDMAIASRSVIPKKIHYCWFSGNPMPAYLKKCIESWYKYCPDYEIIRWDESNYDVDKNLYMRQAYQAKKWGFVPDIARLDILYQHGGIYLDTDVELLRSLDPLLRYNAFTGVEKWGNINMGGCSGAIPKHPLIKKMLDYRKDETFVLEDGSLNLTTCGYYETIPLLELGMKPTNEVQKVEDMMIFSSDFFHPYDYMSGETMLTENTFSIHHFNGGWLDENAKEQRKKTSSSYMQMLLRMGVNVR